MQAPSAQRAWLVAADGPRDDETAEELIARRKGTADHSDGWIVKSCPTRRGALECILLEHVGYTAHGVVPDVYVHSKNKRAVVLRIIEWLE